jgi:membrane protease YdiL (CAAX protease family)
VTPADARLRPLEALLCVLASLTGLITLGPLLVSRLGLYGVLLSELALVGLPTLGFLQARGVSLSSLVGRARASSIVGAILLGAGAFWLVALLESTVLERVLPVPPAVRDSLRQFAAPGAPLWLDLLALSLAPAVCEEALFRGVAQPAFEPRLGRAGALVAAALLFALFHLSPYRLVPTALLGLLLGAVRLWSGALWPAIAFHLTNNTLVLVFTRVGLDEPPLPGTRAGLFGLCGSVVALTSGIAILTRRAQRP